MTDALSSRKITYRYDPISLWWRDVFHSFGHRNLVTIAALIHCSLVLFEQPSHRPGYVPIPEKDMDLAVMFTTAPVEAVILAVYIFDIFAQIRFMGWSAYATKWNVVELVCTVIFAFDVLTSSTGLVHEQFSRVFRPLFVVTKRKIP